VNAEAVGQWLSERRAEGMPAAACNTHLDDLLNFVEWCLREGRLDQNPIKGIKHLKEVKTDAGARPLTEEELGRLVRIGLWRPLAEYGRVPEKAAGAGDRVTGVRFIPVTVETLGELVLRGRRQLQDSPAQIARLQRQGWQRALIYKALALTGLRRSELLSLKISGLRRGRSKSYLLLGATDPGKGTKIPLRSDLAADLKLWVRYRWRAARRRAGDRDRAAVKQAFLGKPLFKLPGGLVKALALDLAAAGIGETDERGVRVDIYAARGVREEILSRAGVPLAVLRAEMDEPASGSGGGRSGKGKLLRNIVRRRRTDG
jgi:integrase